MTPLRTGHPEVVERPLQVGRLEPFVHGAGSITGSLLDRGPRGPLGMARTLCDAAPWVSPPMPDRTPSPSGDRLEALMTYDGPMAQAVSAIGLLVERP
jgi:hypothetical protein